MTALIRSFGFCLACAILLTAPVVVFSSGGGGGGGGGDGGGGEEMTEPGMIFFEPEEGNLETEGGEIIMNDFPQPGQPFITMVGTKPNMKELERAAAAARDKNSLWDFTVNIVEIANAAGKASEWGLAFTPVGLGTKTALSAARGYAEGGTEGAAKNTAVSVLTSPLPPAVGIAAGEMAEMKGEKGAHNSAPVPSEAPPVGGTGPAPAAVPDPPQ